MRLISILLLCGLVSVNGVVNNAAVIASSSVEEQKFKRNVSMLPNEEIVKYKYVCYDHYKGYTVCRWVYSENENDFGSVIPRSEFRDQYNKATKIVGGLLIIPAIVCLIM